MTGKPYLALLCIQLLFPFYHHHVVIWVHVAVCPFLVCSMVAQERLNRITKFVDEMALANSVPLPSSPKNHLNVKSPRAQSGTDWMASAIPVDHAITLAAAAAGIISEEEASSRCEYSTRSATVSDPPDQYQTKDMEDDGQNARSCDDSKSENLENKSDGGHTPGVTPRTPRRNKAANCRSLESLFR